MRRDRENQLDLADVGGEANAATHGPNIRPFVRRPKGVDTGIVAVIVTQTRTKRELQKCPAIPAK
jgi:hypothetical protein